MQGASRESLAALRDRFADAAADLDGAGLGQLSGELFAVVSLLAGQGGLRRTVSDPGLEPEAKQRFVDRLFAGRVSDTTVGLLRTIARSRWSEPRDVVDAVENLAVEAGLVRAEQAGDLDEVEDGLFRFERIVDGEPALRAALTDRLLPADRKVELLHRLLDGKVGEVTFGLVERAVVAPRGRTLERVLREFSELAAARREQLIARVTSAIPLNGEQQRRLAEALRTLVGHEVRLQVVVDPSLVGGLSVRIGDELIDGSVLRQLGEARRRLTRGSDIRF